MPGKVLCLPAKVLRKVVKCVICGTWTYLECVHCYAILQYPGEEHACTDSDMPPGIYQPILCVDCDMMTVAILYMSFMMCLIGELYRTSLNY